MKINWIPADGSTPKETRRLIKKEYTFRKRMLKYILSDMVFDDCGENYDCLIFDLDTKSASFSVSSKTPQPYYSSLEKKLRALDL